VSKQFAFMIFINIALICLHTFKNDILNVVNQPSYTPTDCFSNMLGINRNGAATVEWARLASW
jgi:hypothetical protein